MRATFIGFVLVLCFHSLVLPAAELEVITSGQRKWELLMDDLAQARSSICMEYFVFADDSSGRLIRDVLMHKAQEGIPVKLIIENVINAFMQKRYFKEMEAAGIDIRFFTADDKFLFTVLPDINFRDHRKIAVIDGRIGYVGGMNIARPYHVEWRDTHVRFEGPAAGKLEEIFYQSWHWLDGTGEPTALYDGQEDGRIELVPGGPFYPVFLKRYVELLDRAEHYAYFQTPYFIPPDTLLNAMRSAVERGVDVRLLVPRKTDHITATAANQSFFPALLEAGVRVYEYLPRFNHSKVVVSDDRECWVGSVNLDNRSFFIDYEIAACIRDEAVALGQKATFLEILEESHQVTPEDISGWTPLQRISHHLPRILLKQL